MTPDEELAIEEHEDERARRRGWLPWLVLAAVIAVIIWLIWNYSDFGRAPDQADVAKPTEQTAKVPDVVGMSRGSAIAALEAAGFSVQVEVSYDTVAEPGTVVSQDPAAGSEVGVGATVFIGVAEGVVLGGEGEDIGREDEAAATIPDVVGMSRSQAVSVLRANGYQAAVSELYTEQQPEGLVFEQTPKAGSSADPGTTVGLLVSLGRAPATDVTAPDLLGLPQAEAERRIIAAGLEPRVMVQPKDDKAGIVYQQQPAGGTAVARGSYLFILVGAKP